MSRTAVQFGGLYWISMKKFVGWHSISLSTGTMEILLDIWNQIRKGMCQNLGCPYGFAPPLFLLYSDDLCSRIFISLPSFVLQFYFVLSINSLSVDRDSMNFVFILSTTMFWYYSFLIRITFAKQFTSHRSLQSDTDNLWTVSLQNTK
jgi:hypothetical protein